MIHLCPTAHVSFWGVIMAEDLMNMMGDKMRWLEARQKLIAQNIGNADTSGYRPHDLKPLDFKQVMKSTTSPSTLSAAGSLVTTRGNHITSAGGTPAGIKSETQKDTYEVAPTGNAVVLEEQILMMNENMMDHRFISNLYQKNFDMQKRAVESR